MPRRRLVRRLIGTRETSLLLIAAPAGYGKTSLLSEWAEVDARPFAWVTITERDVAGAQVVAEMRRALARIDLGEPPGARLQAASATGGLTGDLDALIAQLRAQPRPFVLVLDDAHELTSPDALSLLPALARTLPAASQLVMSSRTTPRMRLARLRAGRELVELRAADLAMTVPEASMLLDAAGLRLNEEQTEMLVRRVEGWPAALSLAALSLKGEADISAALAGFTGGDELLSDYFHEELLDGLADEALGFLRASSVLDRLSAPLCDAVLKRSDSGLLLRRLARREMLLVPLDRTGDWYRCPAPLRAMLRRELARAEPRRAAGLNRRASVWHGQHGDGDAAVAHAAFAGDALRTGELLWARLPSYLAQGRHRLVEQWLRGFRQDALEADVALCLCAGHAAAVGGDLAAASRWRATVAAFLERSTGIDGCSRLEAGMLLLDASIAEGDVARMGRDAARAYELEPESSSWRPWCRLYQGVAAHLTGDGERSRLLLEEAVRGASPAMPTVEIAGLSQLAIMDLDAGDLQRAQDRRARAAMLIDRHRLADEATSAPALAVAALTWAHAGRVDAAKEAMRGASQLLARLDGYATWRGVEARILLARCASRLTEVSIGRTLLAEASRARRRLTGAPVIDRWLDEAVNELDASAAAALDGSSSLTLAELRILRFLPTHLSFREIGDRLHVSTNTVKSQAHAVYRKLDARSRSQAVATASRLGLIWGLPGSREA